MLVAGSGFVTASAIFGAAAGTISIGAATGETADAVGSGFVAGLAAGGAMRLPGAVFVAGGITIAFTGTPDGADGRAGGGVEAGPPPCFADFDPMIAIKLLPISFGSMSTMQTS